MARILVIGKFYPPCRGGTEANTRDVCEALAQRHDVTALVFNHEPGSREDQVGGVRVVRCAVTASFKSQPISLAYWRRIDLRGIGLVHFHAPNFFASAALLWRLRGAPDVPVVITHHSDVQGRRLLRALVLPLYHRLAQRARLVLVTSRKNAQRPGDLPAGARIAVMPLGVRIEEHAISPPLRAEAAAWRQARCGAAPTVAFIGRHARYKGLDVLIQALAALPGVHALIAGDGPFRAGAEALAGRLGVAARAHFLGDVTEAGKLRLLAASDVFAFPSTEVTEAFGIAQLEAMAAGVPVVAADLPTGVTDIAVHERTALVVPAGDAEALAAAVRRLLGDAALRGRLVAGALAGIEGSFSKPTLMAGFCAMVADITSLTDSKL